jgi:hypothetical protein
MKINPLSVLFWAHTAFAWTIANYVVRDSKPRPLPTLTARFFVVMTIVLACSRLAASYPVIILLIALISLLTFARSRVSARYSAELELGTTALFLGASALLTRHAHITADRGLIAIPLRETRIAAVLIVTSALLFAIQGGTSIVRGVLEKSGALPRTVQRPQDVDVKEFNRGRLIGALERVLLAVLVALEQYAALGFVFAAKGLIRSHEFEDRDLSEYFLIGSLTSVTLAVSVGLLIRVAIVMLW